jgi:hypothetical protein
MACDGISAEVSATGDVAVACPWFGRIRIHPRDGEKAVGAYHPGVYDCGTRTLSASCSAATAPVNPPACLRPTPVAVDGAIQAHAHGGAERVCQTSGLRGGDRATVGKAVVPVYAAPVEVLTPAWRSGSRAA